MQHSISRLGRSTSQRTIRHLSKDASSYLQSAPETNAFVTPVGFLKPQENSLRVAIKDNICTKDFPTTCSSSALQNFRPPYDATVVQLLKQSGATIVGKTNCDEFGMGSANVHSFYGPVINPFHSMEGTNSERSAGGSSGGSAAAVAEGSCDFALGTDTGGSTRLPAAYCGVVGFKPSYGLISRWGVVSFADSLDCVGILARSSTVIAEAFDVLEAYDRKDTTSVEPALRKRAFKENSRSGGDSPLAGVKIGIPKEFFPKELDASIYPSFRTVLNKLKEAGSTLHPVSLPSTPYSLSAYYVISSAEASSNLARYDGMEYGEQEDIPLDFVGTAGDFYALTRSKHFGKEVQRRILLGTYALTAGAFDNYFLQAQRIRQLVRDDFDRVFNTRNVTRPHESAPFWENSNEKVDFLVHPSAIRTAPTLAEAAANNSTDTYVQDILTVPASLAGLPALSIPSGYGEDGWPLGITIVGQWGSDREVSRIGRAIEELTR